MTLKRQKRFVNHLGIGIVIVLLFGVGSPGLAQGELFSCEAPSGTTIFTDSPSQLKNCKPISTDQHLQSLGAGNSSSSVQTHSSDVKEKLPPHLSSSPQGKPPHQPNIELPRDNKVVPWIPLKKQTCGSPVSPSNPFLNTPCPSAGD